ncbi:MAG: choice-of-anchor D domain-containing protein [Candidatus Sumerlaeia bacterium]
MGRMTRSGVRAISLLAGTIFFLAMTSFSFGASTRYYVDGGVSASGGGTSWAAAFKTIEEAVAASAAGDEIWVAQGNYSLAAPIALKDGLKIYGGLANDATTLTQQNVVLHPTVVSGAGLVSTPFVMSGIANGRLDGLTIQDSDVDTSGGAVSCVNIDNTNTIANCTIQRNQAGYYIRTGSTYFKSGSGGGIFCENASPVIQNCSILQNQVPLNGGGIFIRGGSPQVISCTVSENGNTTNTYSRIGPFFGGGICIESATVTLSDSMIIANQANNSGGGVSITGDSNVTIDNCTINSNDAVYNGAGIWCDANSPTINACTINGNLAHTLGAGAGVGCQAASPMLINCFMAGNQNYGSDASPAGNGGALACLASSSPAVIHCSIIENIAGYGGVVYCNGSSSPIFTNCVFTKSGYSAIYKGDSGSDPHFTDCVFSDIGYSDYLRYTVYYQEQLSLLAAIVNPIFGAPQFKTGLIGHYNGIPTRLAQVTSRVYRYSITDAYADYMPGELAGKTAVVRWQTMSFPDYLIKRQAYVQVLDNTTTTILVAAPVSDLNYLSIPMAPMSSPVPGGWYQIIDNHLGFGSLGIDQATSVGVTVDRDGYSRPIDIAGQGADGSGALYDMGSYETLGIEPADVEVTTSTCPLYFRKVLTPSDVYWVPYMGINDLTVPITNRGFSTLNFTGPGLAFGGANASDFSIVGTFDTAPLAPGQSRSVTLRFDPPTSGTRSADLLITTNDPAKPTLRYPLTGTGIYLPWMHVLQGTTPVASGSEVYFGSCLQGRTVTRTFTVRNDGDAPLLIYPVNGYYEFSVTEPLNTVIPAGQSDTFTVAMSSSYYWGPVSYDLYISEQNTPYPTDYVLRLTGTILQDASAPSVVMTSAVPSTTNLIRIPVSVTFSEVVTGFAADDVSLVNCTLSEFAGSGASYSFVLTPIAPGTVSASIGAGAALDLAKNPNTAGSISRTYENVLDPSLVWVQFGFAGTELGTPANPFNTIGEGVAAASSGATVRVLTGQSSEHPRITKAMRIEASGGAVRIGAN